MCWKPWMKNSPVHLPFYVRERQDHLFSQFLMETIGLKGGRMKRWQIHRFLKCILRTKRERYVEDPRTDFRVVMKALTCWLSIFQGSLKMASTVSWGEGRSFPSFSSSEILKWGYPLHERLKLNAILFFVAFIYSAFIALASAPG